MLRHSLLVEYGWLRGVNTECCRYGVFETKTPAKPCRSVKYD